MEFDPIETCPYDIIHRIRRSRMQFHIRTCSKNFSSSEKMQCPFDARHKVDKVDFEYHVDHCPLREYILDCPDDDLTQAGPNILPINVEPVKVPHVEKWDQDEDFQTYSPLQAIQDKPIVHPIIGLSRAKKRKHRIQERRRYNEIVENSRNQPSTPTNSLSVENEKDKQKCKPLRQPYSISKTTNSDLEDKNKNLTPSKDSKKLPTQGNKISNAPEHLKREKSPVSNNSKGNNSVIDELARTLKKIEVEDKSYKEKIKPLDEEINRWKLVSSKKKNKQIVNQK